MERGRRHEGDKPHGNINGSGVTRARKGLAGGLADKSESTRASRKLRAEKGEPKRASRKTRAENCVANSEAGALCAPDFLIRCDFVTPLSARSSRLALFGSLFSARPFRLALFSACAFGPPFSARRSRQFRPSSRTDLACECTFDCSLQLEPRDRGEATMHGKRGAIAQGVEIGRTLSQCFPYS